MQTLNPKPEPYTLHPTPYALHPEPYTLHLWFFGTQQRLLLGRSSTLPKSYTPTLHPTLCTGGQRGRSEPSNGCCSAAALPYTTTSFPSGKRRRSIWLRVSLLPPRHTNRSWLFRGVCVRVCVCACMWCVCGWCVLPAARGTRTGCAGGGQGGREGE